GVSQSVASGDQGEPLGRAADRDANRLGDGVAQGRQGGAPAAARSRGRRVLPRADSRDRRAAGARGHSPRWRAESEPRCPAADARKRFLRRPATSDIARFLGAQQRATFSYADVGATRGLIPPHYTVDHHRVALGRGQAAFDRAVAALRRWEMFNLDWVAVEPRDTPLEYGRDVAVV